MFLLPARGAGEAFSEVFDICRGGEDLRREEFAEGGKGRMKVLGRLLRHAA